MLTHLRQTFTMALLTLRQELSLLMPFEPRQVFGCLLLHVLGLWEDGRCEGRVAFHTAPLSIKEVIRADPGPLVGLPGFGGILWVLSLHSCYPELPLGRVFGGE